MDFESGMEEKKLIRRQFSKVGGSYFLFAVLSFLAQILMLIAVQLLAPELLNNSAVSLLISMVPMYCIAAPVCILLMRTIPAKSPEKKRMKPGHFLIVLIMTYAGMYVGNLIGLVITAVIGAVKGSAVNNDIAELITGTDMWGTVLVVVLIAPVVEEFLFRKLLIDRIVQYGEGMAVLLSGMMFGLFHGNLNQFFYAFIIGMMFAFIYIKTGNIWYTVLLHMIINFFGSVVAVLVLQNVDLAGIEKLQSIDPSNVDAFMEQLAAVLPSMAVYLVYVFFLLGVMLTGIILFALKRRRFVCDPGRSGLTAGEKRGLAFGNVGMILYIIFWIVMMVVQLFQ